MGRWKNSKTQVERFITSNSDVERKCPLGWYPEVEVDDTNIKVVFKYLARNRVDREHRPIVREMDYEFTKQEIIYMIPDEDYTNAFSLVNRVGKRDDERWEIIHYITNELSNDFEEIQSRTRSTSEMYAELLRKFANDKKYKYAMEELARYEALMSLLRKPKAFQGDDVRNMM